MSVSEAKLKQIKEISICYRLLDLYLIEANKNAFHPLFLFKDWLLKQQYRLINELRHGTSESSISHPE